LKKIFFEPISLHPSAQTHWVRSKPILRVMQLKLYKPTMAIGHSLRARFADLTNPGRCNKLFRS